MTLTAMASEKSSGVKKRAPGVRGQASPLKVAADLRDLIVDGAFKAGARITERAVIERFGCTAASVREAFHLLEKQGAIVVSARRGARVIDQQLAPPSEVFLVWDRLRWLLGEELRRCDGVINDEVQFSRAGVSNSKRLAAAEAALNQLAEAAQSPRIAELMARTALHVMIVAPERFDEIEASLER